MMRVCVIGSGFAGSTVARDLARSGAQVTILEAGIDHNAKTPDNLAVRYKNAGPVEYVLRNRTFRNIGGTSEHWFGNTPRPLPADLRLRTTHGMADDWPFSYDEFEPDLDEAERTLGTAGTADDPLAAPRKQPFPLPGFPLSYSDQLLRTGLAPHGVHVSTTPQARATQPYRGRPACERLGLCLMCPIQARPGPTSTTLADALATGRVTLVSQAFVTHLESGAGGRVTRAVWVDSSGQSQATEADVFVVACHAPDSSRLLLNSVSTEWPTGLGNREDVVGRYFMDNPRYAMIGSLPERTWPNRVFFQTGAITRWRNPADRPQHGAFLIEIQNFIPDASPADIARTSKSWGLDLKQRIRESWGHEALMNAETEMLPSRDNRVMLDPDIKDPFGVPLSRFDVRFSDYDTTALATAKATLLDLFDKLGAKNVGHRSMPRGTLDSCYHPAGGLRMGNDPKTSVTDGGGRVHGLKNLFAAGTCLFPSIGTANPTLTVTALAVRVARKIREHGGRGEL